MENNNIDNDEIKNKNKEILLSVSLQLNKELYDEKIISYKTYKYAEKSIIKKLKIYNT